MKPAGLNACVIGLALLLAQPVFAALPASAEPGAELLDADKAFQLTARLRDAKTVELSYNIADGYYMYRDRFHFAIDGKAVKLASRQMPAGKMKQDATFGRVVTYRNSVRILLPLSLASIANQTASPHQIGVEVTSQGCADVGVCYPPMTQQLALTVGSTELVHPQGEATIGSFSRPAGAGREISETLKRGN